MSTGATSTSPPVPGFLAHATFHRLTVEQYHQMIKNGILGEDDPVELLEGYMVTKMPRSPEHDYAIRILDKRLNRLVPDSFTVSNQCAATFNNSEPEPDFTVARGDETTYRTRHPGPSDTALVIEVSASSLSRDRNDKARIYARASIPVYWVVNVIDKQIEVFTQPSGPCDAPAYAHQEVFRVAMSVPVVLDGNTVGTIAVSDVMG
ncbi:MAG: Uma2 family endonuclease [Planctomycetia bacterium]|nr:Uma2 family endonuclease [Planctomycetia bacterium]